MKKRENAMFKDTYTIEQMKDAETLTKILAGVPETSRKQMILMANSFLLGVKAQEETEKNDN